MSTLKPSIRWWLAGALVTALSTFGCKEAPTPNADNGFVSDDPSPDRSSGYGDDGGLSEGDDSSGNGGGSAGEGEGAESPNAAPEEDPERLITEADIIQTNGDTLYALSRYSGLSIIDLANPDQPRVLGRKALGGEPFEMYLDGAHVVAMFNGWGHYQTLEDGGWEWVVSSHVQVLDATDPSEIGEVASFDLPGQIADSRIVGDVLYTVTFENGWCWDCQPEANTTVSSFDVSNLASPSLVDQEVLSDGGYDYGWQRSISVTDERIYVGGVDWGSDDYGSSTIQIVDISDSEGQLAVGASVHVAGQILSRWQMDEHEGVLRVVSQPWNTSVYPRVETFQVHSSSSVTPLGSTELITPVPESLRAVRFDGERAFAITAEQTDPLYTIDLSDPAAPYVAGFLEIPGWVYHIEPRGDRLLALGFDGAAAGGSLNVSLFDVSDMTSPTLRKRAHFGGDWGNFAEDQDRIHKAFKILPELGLLLVPFSAYEWDDYGCGGYDSGVQLIDWANDDLDKRGVAPIRGQARRAFMHGDRLMALSDEQLRSFDITDRDAPETRGQLQLSAHVSQVAISGEHVVRMSADWWTTEPRLEIVSASDPAAIEPLGALDLGAALASAEGDESCWGWSYWSARMFVHGSTVALVWPSWSGASARVVLVDVSDPTRPRAGAHLDLPMDVYNYGWWVGRDVISNGDTIAQIGPTLAFQELFAAPGQYEIAGARVRFLDISNPDAPALLPPVALPAGHGYTGLVTDGSRFLLSHWEPADDLPGKVRFYLDRIDVTLPLVPVLLEKINVPGSLVAFDRSSSNLVTVDYDRVQFPSTLSECYARGYDATFDTYADVDPDAWGEEVGLCTVLDRKLQLSHVEEGSGDVELLETLDMPVGWLSGLHVGDDRIFFSSNHYTYDYETQTEQYDAKLHVIGGIRAGELETAAAPLDDTWWVSPVAAEGKTMFGLTWPGAMVTLDASDMEDLEATKIGEMPWWVQHVKVHDGRALLSLGPYGLSVLDLSP